nr:MAG TPA: hypothetical protein [Bacteriophage sp.]
MRITFKDLSTLVQVCTVEPLSEDIKVDNDDIN